MKIWTTAVFLTEQTKTTNYDGKSKTVQIGKFHQPEGSDNAFISVVLPSDVEKLVRYESYLIEGELKVWGFKDKSGFRILATKIVDSEE